MTHRLTDVEMAVRLRMLEVIVAAQKIFEAELKHAIRLNPDFAGMSNLTAQPDYKRLADPSAIPTFYGVWRQHEAISREACLIAGLDLDEERQALTAHSLGVAMAGGSVRGEVFATEGKFICEQRKNVDAMINFGLAVRFEVRPNFKPIYPTDRLNEMMIRYVDGVTEQLEQSSPRGDGGEPA